MIFSRWPGVGTMRRLLTAAAAALLSIAVTGGSASAVTIDTNADWTGDTVNARRVVAQTFTVDVAEPYFTTLSVWFHDDAAGQTVDLTIADALTGGTTFFSETIAVTAGRIDVSVETLLAAGTVYAILDFGAYRGKTLDFVGNVYVGGTVWDLNNGGRWRVRADRDLRMTAEFVPAVKLPSSLPLMLVGVCGLGVMARRRRTGG